MKKRVIIISTVVIAVGVSILNFFNKFDEDKYISKNYNYEILSKKMLASNSFDFGPGGEIYVSQGDSIIKINTDNSKEEFLKKADHLIGELKIKDNNMFFISDDKLISINLKSKEEKIVLDNIPNYGDMNKNKILITDKDLYLSTDSATNSAILSEEDISKNPQNKGDISPIGIEKEGDKNSKSKIGAFFNYSAEKDKEANDEIKEKLSIIGTGSVIKINLETFNSELYAYGLRNILGMDIDNNGDIYATVGGIEENGARPLYGDSDYVYLLDEKYKWYGWPDYSGGDPVNSPRFRKEGKPKQEFLLENHPNSPPAPFYQNDSINALGRLLVDKEEVFGTKDSIIIYDMLNESIVNLNKFGEKKEIIKIKGSFLSDIKFYNGHLYFLDNKNGYLVKVDGVESEDVFKYKFFMLGFTFITMIAILIITIFKNKKY